VFDKVSGHTKAGARLHAICPLIIRTPNTNQLQVGGQNKELFVGFEAIGKKAML
jgi:hypothetical protein